MVKAWFTGTNPLELPIYTMTSGQSLAEANTVTFKGVAVRDGDAICLMEPWSETKYA